MDTRSAGIDGDRGERPALFGRSRFAAGVAAAGGGYWRAEKTITTNDDDDKEEEGGGGGGRGRGNFSAPPPGS